MKRLFILAAVLLVAAYASFQFGLWRWPFGDATQSASSQGAGSQGNRGGRGGAADGPVAVAVVDAKRTDVPVLLEAIGTAQALNTVTVRTQTDGRLMKIAFKEGQDVKAGDVLALIDPSTVQAQYDSALAKKAQDEALLANAKIDLDRYTKLAVGNFGSRQQADTQKSLVAQLDAQVRADQANIDNAKASLDFATIRAPIDGRTGIRLVDQGNILKASDLTGIVVLTQVKPIAVIFTLPQQNLRAINAATAKGAVQVRALEPDNTTIIDTGEVAVIDNQVDQTTGTVKIKSVFPNPGLALWPGQFVNLRVQVDVLRNALVVPSSAVQRGPNGAFVYTVGQDNAVKQVNVTTGQQNEREAVIVSGLDLPARLVSSGFSRLTDGAKVQVVQAAAPNAAPGASGESDAPDRTRRQRSGTDRRSQAPPP